MIDRTKMSQIHEAFLAKVFKGRPARGSGNQWHNAADGRHNHMVQPFAFAWDGKATMTKTISIRLDMWDKICEQAGGERPMLALRWYGDERCSQVNADLVVLDIMDFAEMLEKVNSGIPEEQGWFEAESIVRVYMKALDGSHNGYATVDGIRFPLQSVAMRRNNGDHQSDSYTSRMVVNGWRIKFGEIWQDDVLIMRVPGFFDHVEIAVG
jgi:hypothetical protein